MRPLPHMVPASATTRHPQGAPGTIKSATPTASLRPFRREERPTITTTMTSPTATIRHATREGHSPHHPSPPPTNAFPRRPHNPRPHPRPRRLREGLLISQSNRRIPHPHALARRPLRPREPRRLLQRLREDAARHRPRWHRRRHGAVLLQLQHLDWRAGHLPRGSVCQGEV